jgi:ATP-binding cassette subfamily F protein 3
VNRVAEIRDGRIIEYDGNYSYYLQKRENIPVPVSKVKSTPEAAASSPGGKKTKEQKRSEAEARQTVSKERNRLQRQVDELEKKIDGLEKKKEDLETRMAQPETYDNSELAVKSQKEYAGVTKELTLANQQWEKAVTELEKIEKAL